MIMPEAHYIALSASPPSPMDLAPLFPYEIMSHDVCLCFHLCYVPVMSSVSHLDSLPPSGTDIAEVQHTGQAECGAKTVRAQGGAADG